MAISLMCLCLDAKQAKMQGKGTSFNFHGSGTGGWTPQRPGRSPEKSPADDTPGEMLDQESDYSRAAWPDPGNWKGVHSFI
jgi:hypothetical protein